MMEKSSAVFLSAEEKDIIQGKKKLTKAASQSGDPKVPERFQGWYSHDELKDIADEQN